jgi:hypothetical protein
MMISNWKHYAALMCAAVSAACVALQSGDPHLAPYASVVSQVMLFLGGAFFAVSPNLVQVYK